MRPLPAQACVPSLTASARASPRSCKTQGATSKKGKEILHLEVRESGTEVVCRRTGETECTPRCTGVSQGCRSLPDITGEAPALPRREQWIMDTDSHFHTELEETRRATPSERVGSAADLPQ
ncbi:hypothetical protein CSUI_009565 [Cystoisospora suis]|uniref:Uncharacterized protein n=1 Tax=Cystoisospora suis TaxID=483139 RepID=A0A2C6KJ02_9APIC|nr:hypothetical protein CSUI_009565 [Cystoisospora suis]